jgi:hypothetical protein
MQIVWITPESGHRADIGGRLKCARIGHHELRIAAVAVTVFAADGPALVNRARRGYGQHGGRDGVRWVYAWPNLDGLEAP